MRNTYILKDNFHRYIGDMGTPYPDIVTTRTVGNRWATGGINTTEINEIKSNLVNYYREKYLNEEETHTPVLDDIVRNYNQNYSMWWWTAWHWSGTTKAFLHENNMYMYERNTWRSYNSYIHHFTNITPDDTDVFQFQQENDLGYRGWTHINRHYQDSEYGYVVMKSSSNYTKLLMFGNGTHYVVDCAAYYGNYMSSAINMVCSNSTKVFYFIGSKLIIIDKENKTIIKEINKPNNRVGIQCDANDTYLYATDDSNPKLVHRLNIETETWEEIDLSDETIYPQFDYKSQINCIDGDQDRVYINCYYWSGNPNGFDGPEAEYRITYPLDLDLQKIVDVDDNEIKGTVSFPMVNNVTPTISATVSEGQSHKFTPPNGTTNVNFVITNVTVEDDRLGTLYKENVSNYSANSKEIFSLDTEHLTRIATNRILPNDFTIKQFMYDTKSAGNFYFIVFNIYNNNIVFKSDIFTHTGNGKETFDLEYTVPSEEIVDGSNTVQYCMGIIDESFIRPYYIEDEPCIVVTESVTVDEDITDSLQNLTIQSPQLDYIGKDSTKDITLVVNKDLQEQIISDVKVYMTEQITNTVIEPFVYTYTANPANNSPFVAYVDIDGTEYNIEDLEGTEINIDEDTSFTITITGGDEENNNPNYILTNYNTSLLTYSKVDNIITVTPILNQFGITDVTIQAQDGALSTNYTFNVNVKSVNDKPLSTDQDFLGTEDTQLVGQLTSSDVANESSSTVTTYILVDDVANGTLVLNSDGSFTYDPDENWNGNDTFTFIVNDGTDDSEDTYTATLTIASVNDKPYFTNLPEKIFSTQSKKQIINVSATDLETDTEDLVFDVTGTNVIGFEDLGGGELEISFGNNAGESLVIFKVYDEDELFDMISVPNFTEFDWSNIQVTVDPENLQEYSIMSNLFYYKVYNLSKYQAEALVNGEMSVSDIQTQYKDRCIQYTFTDFTYNGLPAYNFSKTYEKEIVTINSQIDKDFLVTVGIEAVDNIFETSHIFTDEEKLEISFGEPNKIEVTKVLFNDRVYYTINTIEYSVLGRNIIYYNTMNDYVKNPPKDSDNYTLGYKGDDGVLYINRFI